MKATFSLPQGTAIEHACSEDLGRFATHGVFIDTVNRRASATNGRMLVVLPISPVDESVRGFDSLQDLDPMRVIVTAEAVAEAEKAVKHKDLRGKVPPVIQVETTDEYDPDKFAETGSVAALTHIGMRNSHKPVQGEFPKFDAVVPAWHAPVMVKMHLDMDLLNKASKALGSKRLTIEIMSDSVEDGVLKKGIRITPLSSETGEPAIAGAFSIMMPIVP